MNKKELGKRLLQMLIVLIGISFLTFLLTYLAPGDPVRTMYTAAGVMPSEEVLEAARQQMGLNDPMLIRYGRWLLGCLHGDFGTSYTYNKAVVTLLLARLWPTCKLALTSMIFMIIIAVPLGMLSATHRNGPIDYIVRAYTFLGTSIPGFWVGLMLLLIFAVKLQLLPVISSDGSFRSLLLPSLTLAFAMSAKYTRQVRTAILEELSQDYVVGARSRGIKESRILWANVFPNSLLPLITMLGLSIGSLLGGTSVVEVIFSYPGMGHMAVNAITAYDYPLVQGYVLWVALIYMVINLIVDISYNYIDPRMRLKK